MQQKVKTMAACLMLAVTLLLTGVNTATAAPLTTPTSRLFGQTRIQTAILVSQAGWQQANTVLVARADDFPDSLVAVPLAHKLNAPILLAYPNNLDSEIMTEIKRLGASKVVLLGGQGIFGPAVTSVLEKSGLAWEQIGGADRYATAALVAQKVSSQTGQVIVANGESFPDAMSMGPYAGVTETPIILSGVTSMPDVTKSFIAKLAQANPSLETVVVGGEGVIPQATLTGIANVTRVAGKDRYETAAKAFWFSQPKLTATKGYLATGEDFPDALVAGALAAKQAAPLFMSDKASLPAMTYSAMGSAGGTLTLVTLIGGPGVISDQVKGIIEGTIQPPYLLAGVTVAVDPGHGGVDPGAIGLQGSYEKNNTLSTGFYLADLLRSAGATVVLTRTTDTSVVTTNYSTLADLEARANIANNAKADLFVSIHNNSYSTPSANGTETWFSSVNPQASRASQFATVVQSEVVKQLGLYDRGIKDAPFVVLKNTLMPAVLVEVGFISNPTEEVLLGSADFQKKAALGIYRGILLFRGI